MGESSIHSPRGPVDCALAIDLGTSGPKVALVALDGLVIASEVEETPLHFLPAGGAEQRPDDWWAAIAKATRRLMGRGVPARIVVVSCTSQYSCTLAVDERGKALANAISWMDTRGAPHVRAITGGFPRVEGYGLGKVLTWLRLTGGAPAHSGKDSLAHILFLKNERPEIYRATHKFLEPKDYLNLRLTGKFAATYDSINLHWLTDNRDISRIRYSDKLLRMAGVDRAKLPDLHASTEILGPLLPEPAGELGIPAGVPVVAGTTDSQSAAIGSGAVKDFETHLYLGTSSWMSCYVPFKRTDLAHNMASLPSAIPGRYYIANEQECAGVCLTYLRDNLVFADDALSAGPRPESAYALFDRVAESVPAGSDRVLFTPWLVGERTPVENHTVRGGFHNLSLKTPRSHLVRAVLEGVALNARWLHGCIERFCKRRIDDINLIGGGASSDVWCQIYADVLDRAVRKVKSPRSANARGAGLVGSVAIGRASFSDVAARVEIEKTFRPSAASRAIYDELFSEFLEIYRRNKAIYARLNRARG